jgi:peptidoglycan/xylan/chitin deacetylase (PgdA/CDA1 family)
MRAGPFTRRTSRARKKYIWAGTLRALGLLAVTKRWVRSRGTIVLTFHRVLDEEELGQTASLPGMIVRTQTFDRFLEYAREQYDIIDLSRDPEWRRHSKLKIAITFDDGWSDSATGAYPLGRKHNVPMTIFIVPQRTGVALPFWPEQAGAMLRLSAPVAGLPESRDGIERVIEELKGLTPKERKLHIDRIMPQPVDVKSSALVDKTMSWEQIFRLRAGGVTFGSHTSTHEILTSIPAEQAQEEIAGSRALIEEKVGGRCSLFSYPNGNCSRAVRDLVARAGYRLAFLNQEPGVWTQGCDPYMIPRVNVCEYHLVDAQGKFSPLIFEYAVVWQAARRLIAGACAGYLRRLTARVRSWGRPISGPARNKSRANQAG